METESATSDSELAETDEESASTEKEGNQELSELLGEDAHTSSAIFEFVEFVVAGASLGGLYAAGQAGQLWTGAFAGSTLFFIYLERRNRKELDVLIERIRSYQAD